MKHIILPLLLTFAVMTSKPFPIFAKEVRSPSVQLLVHLADGSRLVGTTTLASLPLRSEALGKIEIPLDKIRTVTFSRDHESVTVVLGNGDKVQGGLGNLILKLRTSFGDVTIPVEHVTTLNVSVRAGDDMRFNAAADFSADSNPNGLWSYGWSATAGGEFQIFTEKINDSSWPDLRKWNGKEAEPSVRWNAGTEIILLNGTLTIHSGQLALHPGARGEYSVVRWTAPRSGRFQIAGVFTGLSGYNGAPVTTTDVFVFHNQQSIFGSSVNLRNRGNESPFEMIRDVQVGDTVDFVVGCGNGRYEYDATGLNAVITLLP